MTLMIITSDENACFSTYPSFKRRLVISKRNMLMKIECSFFLNPYSSKFIKVSFLGLLVSTATNLVPNLCNLFTSF